MDFFQYQHVFEKQLGVKKEPNPHEKLLFERAKKYVSRISWIPGIRMIAIVNSLSMYATHEDSDIDLFIITAKNRMWFVRVLLTFIFWISGVWRRGEDIAGNFCLSFFITEEAMSLENIRIEDDIYLFYWIYFMKPIIDRGNAYERFLAANTWVRVDEVKKSENRQYTLPDHPERDVAFLSPFMTLMDTLFRYFGERRARRSHREKGSPDGVIITQDVLKFHDNDQRKKIRDAIVSGDSR